jgi:hypothetical protein
MIYDKINKKFLIFTIKEKLFNLQQVTQPLK